MWQQIRNFRNTTKQIVQILGPTAGAALIRNSIYSVTMGSNDYLNNYFVVGSPSPVLFTPRSFQDRIINTYRQQLTVSLYNITVSTSAANPPINIKQTTLECCYYQLGGWNPGWNTIPMMFQQGVCTNELFNILLCPPNILLMCKIFLIIIRYACDLWVADSGEPWCTKIHPPKNPPVKTTLGCCLNRCCFMKCCFNTLLFLYFCFNRGCFFNCCSSRGFPLVIRTISFSAIHSVCCAQVITIRCPRGLQTLVNLGARKFILSNVGPLGCIPYRRTLDSTTNGQCVQSDNTLVLGFNAALKSLVDEFNGKHPNAKFVLADSYNVVSQIINNPTRFGMYHR